MGRLFARLDEDLIDWIGKQHMFFVATAPTSVDGLTALELPNELSDAEAERYSSRGRAL